MTTPIKFLVRINPRVFPRLEAKRAASTVSTPGTNIVFNKKLRIMHLDRSASARDSHVYDYIRDHVAKDICDRVDDLIFKDKRFILNVGSCSGLVIKNLNPDRVENLVQTDISARAIRRARASIDMLPPKFPVNYVGCDEELLPFKAKSFDLVMSCLDLHWVNDLITCFLRVHDSLKDNSPFMGAMFGGDTLYELRSSLQLAEMERLSGISPHVAPKTTGQDIARLLQGSGFRLITVDNAEFKIRYPSMFELIYDLQGMGENNASIGGSAHLHRDVLKSAAAIYQHLYGTDDLDKGVPATFQIINFIGWKNPKSVKA